ncbi:hypothetical protein GUITHDRAFT_90646 [Guillardia theta CCMP2712]|uniref:UBX domain-containing protein n=1 Tax=Guillardia theta (strain CCMP2712) TaxID=905079 RepID=L1ICL7_GUITC|nr:hypothetical protein GUITHDRAFT_90646 [Guillardia theta CCMP2712]EKX33807.1 hypothetical protein GUITHDRAFT_90646 [Guillardia theta CCMP2712]|eukprot:XP_005820787.1 hypothetical protein GUITHDRAFT_90646 [Guillardia theta CCMP2712]
MQVPVSGKEDDEGSYLFPPPAKLMFQGNFDKLREKAEGEEKYCLVNLQKRDIFHSQMLNRDTWSNELVTAVVTSKFIFWQQEFESTAGRQYLSIYPSYTFPVIDIIDPLTGALLERIEEYIAPKDLVERLSRFLDSHQWGKMGKALQVASSSALSAPQPSIPSVKGPGNMETKSRMSLEDEDAELHAAIEASLQDNPAFPPDGCLDDDGDRGRSENIYSHYTDSLRVAQDIEFQKSLEEDRRKEQARLEEQRRIERIKREAEEAERQRERQLEDVRNSLPPEPSKEDRSATHIQLRFPDGSRHSRRFLDTETLKVVLDFMFVCGADPEKHTLATAFPRKILDEADKSLKDLGLSHHISLNVEKK